MYLETEPSYYFALKESSYLNATFFEKRPQ